MPVIVGLDPGRDKCGVAVRSVQGDWLFHRVVPATETLALLQQLVAQYGPAVVVMGDQTTAQSWRQWVQDQLPGVTVALVDERYSTLEAQRRYWEVHPARGWRRWLPRWLRPLPGPVDDVAAMVLVERYCQRHG
ncbi:MAG: pre-16S rRNA-processing nuclease YqgF [Gloeomargarita sp. GMQP_bins_120]